MPRNASGIYTLPAGNPVVTNTTITSTWANTTMPDIGSEMTNSLDRSGRGGMLAALKGVDGAVGAPLYSFTNEPTSGIYRKTAGSLGISVLGSDVLVITATGAAGTFSGTFAGTHTGVGNFSAVSTPPLTVRRDTTGGLGVQIGTNGAYGTYASFQYNTGANTQGFIGGSDQLVTSGAVADFAIRGEANTIFAISNTEIGRFNSNGFGIGGVPIASLAAAGRGLITANGSSDAAVGLGVGGVAKGNMYSNGTDMSVTNQAGGNLLLGTNGSSKWALDSSGRLFSFGITPSASGLEVIGAANTVIIRGGTSGQYQGLRIYNDLNTAGRGLEIDYAGSAYASAFLTNGPTGEQGAISTTGNFPLSFGTNGAIRFGVTSAGIFASFADGGSTGYEVGFRDLPPDTTLGNAAALTLNQRGKLVVGAYSSLQVTTGVFSRGHVICGYNDQNATMTMTQGAGFTLRLHGTSTTGSRTIAVRGFWSLVFNSSTEAVMNGDVS